MHVHDLPESLRWRFSDIAPTVDAAYCLNSRHKAAACTRCAAACPVQAITLTEDIPALNAWQCVGCGICQVACPTDVFGEPIRVEAKLVQTVSQSPVSALLVCPLKAAPELTATPVEVVVRHKRCLAALSVSDLLELAQQEKRVIWLDDSPCATCPLSTAQRVLQESVVSAQRLLQSLDSQAQIELCDHYPELADVKPMRHRLLDGMQPKISRRRLFGLADSATHKAGIVDSESEYEPANGEGTPSLQRVPSSRVRLLEQLRRLSSQGEAKLAGALVPFADVEIDEQACSACALCAHFCPTAALQFDVSEQEFAIRFRADHCIGCDLCKIACPEDAIHIGETIDVGKLVAQEESILVESELAACSVCGADTAVRGDAPLCHSCRHGAGVVTALRDDAGLMADLLSRILP